MVFFSPKEDCFLYDFCAGTGLADMLLWMMSHCCILVKDGIVQLITTLTSQLSYPPAIGPTLGARFSCHGCYYPLHRGSSGTGAMAVDKEIVYKKVLESDEMWCN